MDDKDIGKLQTQVEEFKSIQSGLDRTITDLQKNNKKLQDEKTEMESKLNGSHESEQAEFLKKSAVLDRKEQAIRLSKEKDIDIDIAFDMLGLNDLSDAERLDKLVSMKDDLLHDYKDQYAKDHGRSAIHPVDLNALPALTYSQLDNMSEADLKRLPPSVLNNVVEQEMKQKAPTLGSRLRGQK